MGGMSLWTMLAIGAGLIVLIGVVIAIVSRPQDGSF